LAPSMPEVASEPKVAAEAPKGPSQSNGTVSTEPTSVPAEKTTGKAGEPSAAPPHEEEEEEEMDPLNAAVSARQAAAAAAAAQPQQQKPDEPPQQQVPQQPARPVGFGAMSMNGPKAKAGGFGGLGLGKLGAGATRGKASALGFDAPGAKAQPKAPELTKSEGPGGPVLIRRKFDWKDLKFLARLVRRGVPVDEEWAATWKEYCEQKKVPSDFREPLPKDALTEFVERNLHELRNKEWAKDLYYKQEGEDDVVPPSPEPEKENEEEPSVAPAEDAATAVVEEAAQTTGQKRSSASVEQSSSGSDAEKQVDAEKKEKKDKKEKKRRKESTEKQNEGSEESSGNEELGPNLPDASHKTRMCFAFLEGKCFKDSACTMAHREADLKLPGVARREYQERLDRRARREEKKRPKEMAVVPVRPSPQVPQAFPPKRPPPHPAFQNEGMPPQQMPPQRRRLDGVEAAAAAAAAAAMDNEHYMMMFNPMMGMGMGMGMMMPGSLGMMGPHMMPPPMPMLAGHPPGVVGSERKAKRREEKEAKGKKQKQKEKEKEKVKDKEKEKEKGKEKKEKGVKEPKETKEIKEIKEAKESREKVVEQPPTPLLLARRDPRVHTTAKDKTKVAREEPTKKNKEASAHRTSRKSAKLQHAQRSEANIDAWDL